MNFADLADLVLVAHALFVAFVVGGLVAVILGASLHWRWVRSFRFRLAHLLAIGCVVLESWLGFLCPLTSWEMQLRQRAGEATYPETFIAHWLHELLFFAAPGWLFALCYTLFGGAVLAAWFLWPPRRPGSNAARNLPVLLGSEHVIGGHNGFPIEMSATHGRMAILFLIAVAAIIGVLFSGPIPQDPAYHFFADNREFVALPNFWNVLSSLPFLVVGLYGLRRRRLRKNPKFAGAYTAFCLGAIFTGLGSAYYHYAPSTSALFLDRLAMTVAFMALFSMVLEERVIPGSGALTLWPLLAFGVGAVTYWYWSEGQGSGDLRAYALVQFLPMLLLPLILLMFPGRYLSSPLLWSALTLYFLAKVFENFDHQLFAATRMLSGHTLKHLLASLAALCIVLAVPTGRDER